MKKGIEMSQKQQVWNEITTAVNIDGVGQQHHLQ